MWGGGNDVQATSNSREAQPIGANLFCCLLRVYRVLWFSA